MSTLQQNIFTSYNLNEDEQTEGSKLTIPQMQVMQNLLSQYAEDRLKLNYDPNKMLEFVQQDYFCKGAMAVLELLINTSNSLQFEQIED